MLEIKLAHYCECIKQKEKQKNDWQHSMHEGGGDLIGALMPMLLITIILAITFYFK